MKLRADADSAFELILGVPRKQTNLQEAANWFDGHSAPVRID
jgi:hypothetical protein